MFHAVQLLCLSQNVSQPFFLLFSNFDIKKVVQMRIISCMLSNKTYQKISTMQYFGFFSEKVIFVAGRTSLLIVYYCSR